MLLSAKSEHYPGLLYAIAGEQTRLVKIGRTRGSAEGRLAELQTNSPDRLVLLATAPRWNCEWRVHTRLAKHRLHGEWFSTEITRDIERWLGSGRPFVEWVDRLMVAGGSRYVPRRTASSVPA